MMWITQDEAFDMYAQFWAYRHGRKAVELAREAAKAHERRGDHEGYTAWNDVAERIERKHLVPEAPAYSKASLSAFVGSV